MLLQALGAHIITSNENFILKYFRCRDGKRTETRIGMEGICITHSCIPPRLYSFYAHAHETTPTSGYKLSHTHIVVEEGP